MCVCLCVHRPVLEAWRDGSADLPPVQWKAAEAGGTPGKSQCWTPRAQLLHVDLPDHQGETQGGVEQRPQILYYITLYYNTTRVSDLWIERFRISKDVKSPGEVGNLWTFTLKHSYLQGPYRNKVGSAHAPRGSCGRKAGSRRQEQRLLGWAEWWTEDRSDCQGRKQCTEHLGRGACR